MQCKVSKLISEFLKANNDNCENNNCKLEQNNFVNLSRNAELPLIKHKN